jgi:hypothetical protein
MGVNVDKAGGDDQARRFDRLARLAKRFAYCDDPAIADRYIRRPRGRAGPIKEPPRIRISYIGFSSKSFSDPEPDALLRAGQWNLDHTFNTASASSCSI